MCKTPNFVRNAKWTPSSYKPQMFTVPCGKCPQCISKRIAEWKWRMEQEMLHSTTPYFVTLTYNRQSVPVAEIDISGKKVPFRVLNPKHLTDYLKLLRFHYAKTSKNLIRYFAVGEYGTKKGRPHYHIILLNCDDIRLICDTWKYGRVDISPVRSIDSVGYCLGYLKKKCSFVPPMHPQFSRMSKGLGRSYITPSVIAYHNRRDSNCSVTLVNGREIMLPKYMKDRIYDDSARYKLGKYLQSISDKTLDEKVESVMRSTGKSEEVVRREFYVEPFIEKPKLARPTVM